MKRGPKPKGPEGHPYYALGGLEAVTREQADFCARRVGGLLTFSEAHRPLKELLANAYWLGLQDAVEMYVRQGVEFKPIAQRDIINITPETH